MVNNCSARCAAKELAPTTKDSCMNLFGGGDHFWNPGFKKGLQLNDSCMSLFFWRLTSRELWVQKLKYVKMPNTLLEMQGRVFNDCVLPVCSHHPTRCPMPLCSLQRQVEPRHHDSRHATDPWHEAGPGGMRVALTITRS